MTLLAPLFLLGLGAIALPIWLHRLSSENPNRQPFSSLMFLEPGEPRRVLAKNLQYWLLLALRIGAIALLALAFAGPSIWRSPAAASSGSATLNIIALDESASMGYTGRFDEARNAADEIIDGLGAEDRGQVVAAGRITEVLTQPTLDHALLRQAVRNAEPGVHPLDFGQLMRSLDGLVRAAELPVVIHIVTDAQRTGLPARFAELAPRGQAELVVHAVGGGDDANWAVESLGGSALTGQLTATVASFADTDADKRLRLEHEGKLVEEREITIPAHGTVRVDFDALDLAPGSNRVTARLVPGDGLAADDARYIALRRAEPRDVLIVSQDRRGRDALFLQSAVGTLEALVLVPTIVDPVALDDVKLDDYQFVMVTDAGLLDADAGARLRDYVESGRGLLMGMGERSLALASVPVTGEMLKSSGSLRGGEYTSVGDIDTSHPALAGIESIRGARYSRFESVEPAAEDRVLLRLQNGEPLLIESDIGAGRAMLYTSTFDRAWNDLAVQPVFVPFVSGLANHLLGGQGFSNQAELGSTLAVRAMGLTGGQIFDPEGEVALGLGGTGDVVLDQIGFYEVVGGGTSQHVAVNFVARESDLEPVDAATLERWTRLGSMADDNSVQTGPTSGDERVAMPLGLWILALLIVVAIMETWAGNWHLRVRRGIAA